MNRALITAPFVIVSLSATALSASLPSGAWVNLGPTAISGAWGTGAGRISSIVVSDTGDVVVAAASGGLWRRDHASGAWSVVGDSLSSLSFGALTRSGSTYYAASGERNYYCSDCTPGNGIFQSTDDGRTWRRFSDSPVKYASALRVTPDGQTLWVAGDSGVFTKIGNDNWQPVFVTGNTPFDHPTDIAIDPANPNHVFVTDGNGIEFRNEPGGPWSFIAVDPQTVSQNPAQRFSGALAISPRQPNVMYASFAYAAWSSEFQAGCLVGVFKNTNGGQTQGWTPLNIDDFFWPAFSFGNTPKPGTVHSECQGTYDNALAVDPNDSNNVLAGGVTLMHSTDGGTTWSVPVTMWGTTKKLNFHPDQHAIAFDNFHNAYVGNDGGIFKIAFDGTITNLSAGLVITQFYQRASTAPNDSMILAGTQDNGTTRLSNFWPLRSGAGTAWTAVYDGDGSYTAINPANPNLQYIEYVKGDLEGTTNGGSPRPSFTPIGPGPKHSAFYMPFVVDPTNWDTVYAGADNIYKTTIGGRRPATRDGGSDPAQAWTNLTASDPNWYKTKYDVTALDVGNGGQTIIAGRTDYELLISTAGGADGTWSVIPRLQGIVMSILINPANPDEAFVATKYENNSALLRISGLLSQPNLNPPDIRRALPPVDVIRSLSGQIVVGTDHGVWALTPGGGWQPVGQGLPAVPVRDVVQMTSGALIAFTHGRGAWILQP